MIFICGMAQEQPLKVLSASFHSRIVGSEDLSMLEKKGGIFRLKGSVRGGYESLGKISPSFFYSYKLFV